MNIGRVFLPLIFFTALPIGSLIFIWGFLPTQIIRFSLISAALLITIFTSLRLMVFPIIASAFFTLLTANFVLSNTAFSSLYVSAFIFIAITLIGLLARRADRLPINWVTITHWSLLGFLTAQINSILVFWPFTYFEHTFISFIVFYSFWQFLYLISENEQKSVLAHFIFVGMAVMVVLGSIIWINFPQLRAF